MTWWAWMLFAFAALPGGWIVLWFAGFVVFTAIPWLCAWAVYVVTLGRVDKRTDTVGPIDTVRAMTDS